MSAAIAVTPAPPAFQPTHISVTFKIVTPDLLRRITFSLTRMQGAGGDSWSIMFELEERAETTQSFQMLIQFQVDVNHNDNENAALTAKNGLNSDQHSQTLVAGDTAKDARNGDATLADARDDASAVITLAS